MTKVLMFLSWCQYWRDRGVKGIFINYHPHIVEAIGTRAWHYDLPIAHNDNEAKP